MIEWETSLGSNDRRPYWFGVWLSPDDVSVVALVLRYRFARLCSGSVEEEEGTRQKAERVGDFDDDDDVVVGLEDLLISCVSLPGGLGSFDPRLKGLKG